jgi:hypothetical protein
MQFRYPLVVVSWLCAAATCVAQPATPTFVTLITDNDFFAHNDRHYTSGGQVAFVRDAAGLPSWLRELPPLSWRAEPVITLAIGQRLYTPGNTNPKPEEPLDRPYAAWVYVQGDVRTQTGPVVDHLAITAGYVGPGAGGKQLQQVAHHLFRSRVFPGWNEQLRSEPTLMASFERSWPGLLRTGGGHADLSPYAGATLGTPYTYANVGVVARAGRNLPDDLPAAQISLGTVPDGYRGAAGFGWYAWAGIDARAVARNVFLDGNSFRSGPHVTRNPLVADIQLGVVVAWPRARAGLTLVQRSREFDGQLGSDRFGQLSVSFAY